MRLNPRLRVSILALTTKAAGLLPGDTPSLGHLLCRALGTWAMPGRYPRAAGDDVMPAPVRPLVPHLTPSKAPPHHRSTCRLCCPVLMGRPLGVAQSIGPPGGRAAVTTHSPPPPAAALSVQHALSQGCTPCRPEGGLGPHGSFGRQHCRKYSSSEPVLRKWHLLNSFYSAHSPGIKLHHPTAQQLGKEFT